MTLAEFCEKYFAADVAPGYDPEQEVTDFLDTTDVPRAVRLTGVLLAESGALTPDDAIKAALLAWAEEQGVTVGVGA